MRSNFHIRKSRRKAGANKAVIFAVLFLFFFINIIGAKTYPQGIEVNFKISTNESSCNITIEYPNTTNLIDNQGMTLATGYANINTNFDTIGVYNYYSNCGSGNFEVTTNGNKGDISQILLYIFLGTILIFLFGLSVYGGTKIPLQNIRDNEDGVIQINWRKYLKIFSWAMAYMFLIAIVFVMWNLLYAYAQWFAISKFFFYLYRLLMAFALPTLIGIWLMTLINYINDRKIQKFIKKTGLPYDG